MAFWNSACDVTYMAIETTYMTLNGHERSTSAAPVAAQGARARKRPMPKSGAVTTILVVVLFVGVGLSRPTYAYVDLGTGSYLLQLLVAGLFGTVFSAKSLWARVRTHLTRPGREQQS